MRSYGHAKVVTLDDQPPPPKSGLLAARIALFVLSFACSLYFISRLGPPYLRPSRVTARFAYFADHRDEFDVLFIGNSRVRHHVDPEVFDQRMKELGKPSHSFNFGLGSVNNTESLFLVDQVLALKPDKLRLVIVDPGDQRTGVRKKNAMSERFIAWHDLAHTLEIGHAISQRKLSTAKQYEKLYAKLKPHLLAFFYNTTNYGRGASWVAYMLRRLGPLTGSESELDANYRVHLEHIAKRRGFVPMTDKVGLPEFLEKGTLKTVRRNRRAFRRSSKRAMRKVKRRLAAGRRRKRKLTPYERRYAQALVALGEKYGVELIVLLNPRPDTGGDHLRRAAAAGVLPKFLDYSDPRAFPAYFDPKNRFEGSHLHAKATPAFTKLLADDAAKLVGSAPR